MVVSKENALQWIGIVLAIAGIVVAGYMSYSKLADTEVVCVETSTIDCAGVQNSIYAEVGGVPIALFGLAAYATILALLALEGQIPLVSDYGRTIVFGMTLFGVMYSGYLTYLEAFVLEKWCLWCVASALLMVGLFVVSALRIRQALVE